MLMTPCASGGAAGAAGAFAAAAAAAAAAVAGSLSAEPSVVGGGCEDGDSGDV